MSSPGVFIVSSQGKADEWNKKTIVTFSQPVEIPGVGAQILPAGTYVFRLLDSLSDRNIVQIFNEREDHVYATILAIPNYRLKSTNKTVMTFRERASGEPEAIRRGLSGLIGARNLYIRRKGYRAGKDYKFPVLAMPSELATNLAMPVASLDEPPVIALKQAPIEAVKPTGEVVPIAEVVEAPPVKAAAVQTPEPEKHMPKTASLLPLVGLIGLLSLFAGSLFGDFQSDLFHKNKVCAGVDHHEAGRAPDRAFGLWKGAQAS